MTWGQPGELQLHEPFKMNCHQIDVWVVELFGLLQ